MKVAIVSDSHDNLPNIYKAIDIIKKEGITDIIHCGDVCAPAALKEMAEKFNGNIHLAYGNVDGDKEGMEAVAIEHKNIKLYGEKGEIEPGGKKIAFNHYPDIGKQLAATGKYDIVFYGHTHKPWDEMVGNTRLVNPGTLAGMFNKATFAIYDTATGNLELKILELIK